MRVTRTITIVSLHKYMYTGHQPATINLKTTNLIEDMVINRKALTTYYYNKHSNISRDRETNLQLQLVMTSN
jgi:hypothetical protein